MNHLLSKLPFTTECISVPNFSGESKNTRILVYGLKWPKLKLPVSTNGIRRLFDTEFLCYQDNSTGHRLHDFKVR